MHRSRSGFTLIELLVVIAIIAVLVAILLPAVQQAREAARKSQCQNNMKQLGIALHSYLETYTVFPYAVSTHGRCAAPMVATNHTGLISLLPYIDQGNLFNKFDPNQASGNFVDGGSVVLAGGGATVTGNGVLSATRIASFLCPTDDGAQFYTSTGGYYCISGQPSYRTSYNFSVDGATANPSCTVSTSTSTSFWEGRDRSSRALFGVASKSTPRDASDGLSNVVAMSETTLEVDDGRTASWACVQHVGGGINFSDPPNYYINNWYCCAWKTPPNASYRPKTLGEWGSPGSTHVGGLDVLMGDGAVRWISENIDAGTRQRLGYIADGKTTGEF